MTETTDPHSHDGYRLDPCRAVLEENTRLVDEIESLRAELAAVKAENWESRSGLLHQQHDEIQSLRAQLAAARRTEAERDHVCEGPNGFCLRCNDNFPEPERGRTEAETKAAWDELTELARSQSLADAADALEADPPIWLLSPHNAHNAATWLRARAKRGQPEPQKDLSKRVRTNKGECSMKGKLKRLLMSAVIIGAAVSTAAVTAAPSSGASPVSSVSVAKVVAKPNVRVGCTFYSVKIHSSGVDDCFLPSGSLTESVYLPTTTTVYTGAYGGMEVWYHECNNCNSGTMYYVRLPSSSNSYTLYYGFGVTVVQFKYN